MKKQEKQEEQLYEIDDFPSNCHLWNIVTGGSGKGIILLRKIVDSIHSNNFSRPTDKLPSILITGEGKGLVARALVNSLQIEDFRVCRAEYLDVGINSSVIFDNSLTSTAHVITHAEQLSKSSESVIWRYLTQGYCCYYNFVSKNFDKIIHCNGILVMTAKDVKSVPEPIVQTVTHIIELEPYTREQLLLITHQHLKFCGIEYDGEPVLQEIVGQNPLGIREVKKTLKICVMLLRAEMVDFLDMGLVKKAKRLCSLPVTPDNFEETIPF